MRFLASQNRYFTFALIGALQGLVFWLADSYQQPRNLLMSAGVFAWVAGLTIMMAWTGQNFRRLLLLALFNALVFALVTAWSQYPNEVHYSGLRFLSWFLAGHIAFYISLTFSQLYQSGHLMPVNYSKLFQYAWNNAFVFFLAGVFMGVYWLLIIFCAKIFELIGIRQLENIFFTAPFCLITLPTAYGLGIAIVREHEQILLTLRNVFLALCQMLAPLLALIAITFIVTLTFTGLEPLWQRRIASLVFIFLVALSILFINAIYQDGEQKQPNKVVTTLLTGLIITLPIFSALSLYSLYLRIEQYGLMPDRFFGVVIALILGIYGCSYVFALFHKPWLHQIKRSNVPLAGLVATIAILLHTPVLDPLTLSARHQFHRLVSGQVDAEKFDYAAMLRELGDPGKAKLEELKNFPLTKKEIIQQKIAQAYREENTPEPNPQWQEKIEWLNGQGQAIPTDLQKEIVKQNPHGPLGDKAYLYAINLDDDNELEFLFLDESYHLQLYDQLQGKWTYIGSLEQKGGVTLIDLLVQQLKNGKVTHKSVKHYDNIYIDKSWYLGPPRH